MTNANISIRIDAETKERANQLFNKKIARSRRLSISGRWIAFFVKKLKKGYTYDTIFV